MSDGSSSSVTQEDPEAPQAQSAGPWIEIGWVVVPDATGALADHVREAARRVEDRLRQDFRRYRFRSVILERQLPVEGRVRELVDLIDLGEQEREAAHWDFVCAVTEDDLRAVDKPFALGAPASSMNACVLSVARLRPADELHGDTLDGPPLPTRIAALFFHLFGHLNDLPHGREPEDFMYAPRDPTDLDRMQRFSEQGMAMLDEELRKEADPRVEEEPGKRTALRFYLESTWRNREDIVHSIAKARPWTFVLRLSRMATTAASTLIILMLTAEAWDLGTSQSPVAVAAASLLAVLLTTTYVLRRQGLLGRLRRDPLTEQRVASDVSVGLIVATAMATTYACLFLLSLAIAELVFPAAMLQDWATHSAPIDQRDYLTMAGFVATLGVLLGALGASFEGEKYFRHAAVVDEET
ncbi:MAG: hypothetical protein PVI30_16885 [Myxococcales bacterium]